MIVLLSWASVGFVRSSSVEFKSWSFWIFWASNTGMAGFLSSDLSSWSATGIIFIPTAIEGRIGGLPPLFSEIFGFSTRSEVFPKMKSSKFKYLQTSGSLSWSKKAAFLWACWESKCRFKDLLSARSLWPHYWQNLKYFLF